MLPNSDILNKAQYVVGDVKTVLNMPDVKPLSPFSDEALDFLNALSRRLIKSRGFSDVSTFGFWCRKQHLLGEKEKYPDCSARLGRGIIFHSTPSNVAVNFAFSFAAGLIAGNANIVRLPAKSFEQVDIICSTVNELLDGEFSCMKPYAAMLKFPPDRSLYNEFSAMCDTRVIWGGDNTIAELRQSQLPPRANEITFADRFSAVMINCGEYLKSENKSRIAQDFYNDTYLTDQNACTSPRIIFWYGENAEEAKDIFWKEFRVVSEAQYELTPVQAVGKLHALYKAASQENISLLPHTDNLITRIKVHNITSTLMDYKYNSGFFYEYDISDLEEIRPVFDKKCQTLSYIGFDKNNLREQIMSLKPLGIDRIVPVGKTMDFALIWDGVDLIRTMSRYIDCV